ncbi:MAG: Chaperone protein DnaK [Alphaproteobacteria bacterium ADurb.Bin438]|nr:MAG: Chaperone protein DnaK [Alphaproteobacteria bacterium ADurb.Bin438]
MAIDNKLLGQFDLVGIPPAPRGTPQIEVTFDIDANGIVNVSARDKATGKEQTIRIQASGGLKDDEVERMIKDAELHASEDKKRKELVEVKNKAESLVHNTEKTLKEHEAKIPANVKSEIEANLKELKDNLNSEDPELINQKVEKLMASTIKMGENLYKTEEAPSAGSSSSAPNEEPKKSDDNVVDADFEEVKKD